MVGRLWARQGMVLKEIALVTCVVSWIEASSDEQGSENKALRRVIAGYGKEQRHSIGAMGAEIAD